jgi:hypothetical protein
MKDKTNLMLQTGATGIDVLNFPSLVFIGCGLFRISTHSTVAQGRREPRRTTIFGFRVLLLKVAVNP